MKKTLLLVAFSTILSLSVFAQEARFRQPEASVQAQSWFDGGTWRHGFVADAYEQIDVQTFYEQYQKAPQMWDSIFTYLASIDPVQLPLSKNAMQWSHAYVKILDQDLRTPENCQWEQHRRTIDLQWDATGCERYLMTRTPERLTPKNEYNEKKDVQNFVWDRKQLPTTEDCLVIDSDPRHFYLFFPSDIHQACGIGQQPCMPRKVVVKIDWLE